MIDEIYFESAAKIRAKTQALQQLADEFRVKRIKFYSQILEFEAQLVCYFSMSEVEQTVRDLIKYDSWCGMVENIKTMGELSDSDRQIIDAERMNAGFEKLETGMRDALDKLDKISSDIEAIYSQLSMERHQQQGNVKGTSDNIESLSHSIDRESQDMLDWLSSLDFRTSQIDTLRRRQEGTGQWLFEDPEFDHWVRGAERRLWCPGIRMSLIVYLS